MNIFFASPTEEYLLEDISSYRYLTHRNVPVPGMDDHELYRQLLEAMDIMSFHKDEQASIHKIISAVLHFGNMEFKQDRNSDQATLPDNTGLQKNTFVLSDIHPQCCHLVFGPAGIKI